MFDIVLLNGKKESYIKVKENILMGFNVLDGEVAEITQEELDTIMLLKLSEDKTLLDEEEGYEVYLDNKSGFKHFFKDGEENLDKFFEYNGHNALLTVSKKDKKTNGKPDEQLVFKTKDNKNIYLNRDKTLLVYAIIVVGGLVLGNYFNNNVILNRSNESHYDQMIEYLEYNDNLTEEEKNLFANEKLLSDITPYYEKTNVPLFLIDKKFDGLEVLYYDDLPDGLAENVAGWYSLHDLNAINIKNDLNADVVNDVKCHEYIHLLQCLYALANYNFLAEASAELITYEYYGYEINSYSSEVQSLKILMETIGPLPIWEINFAGDDTYLKEIINNNLSPEKATRLLELFGTDPDDYEASMYLEVDNLLQELYESIYNEKWYNNKAIVGIYKGNLNDRYYFNSDMIESKEAYLTEYNYDVQNARVQFVMAYVYSGNLTMEQYRQFREDERLYTKIYFMTTPGSIISEENIMVDDKSYTREEAYKLGYLTIKFRDTIFSDKPNADLMRIYAENGLIFETQYYAKLDEQYWDIENRVVQEILAEDLKLAEEKIVIPSIYDEFPEQRIQTGKTISY